MATEIAEMRALVERAEALFPRLEGLLENANASATFDRIEAKATEIREALLQTEQRISALEAPPAPRQI